VRSVSDVAWRARAQDLLREALAVAEQEPDELRERRLPAGPPRWPGSPTQTRYASGPGVLTLDPFVAVERDCWLPEPPAWGACEAIEVDAAGEIVVATSVLRGALRRPDVVPTLSAVGWGLADGTRMLATFDTHGGSVVVEARATLADGTLLCVGADAYRSGAADGTELRLSVVWPPVGGERRRVATWLSPAWHWGGPTVSVGVDRLVLDADGEPAELWVDGTARRDGDSAGETELPSVLDPGELLDHAIDRVVAAQDAPTPLRRWAARLHGLPPALSTGPEAREVETAARAMLGTLRRALGDAQAPAPCAVALIWDYTEGRWASPLPVLYVVDLADRGAELPMPESASAEFAMAEAVETRMAQRIDLDDHADDLTLQTWRPLAAGVVHLVVPGADRDAASRRLAHVRRRLIELLRDEQWPDGWVDPVLPWLAFGRPDPDTRNERCTSIAMRNEVDAWIELEELLSADRFATLRAQWPDERSTIFTRCHRGSWFEEELPD
jgi:hypothetical protein